MRRVAMQQHDDDQRGRVTSMISIGRVIAKAPSVPNSGCQKSADAGGHEAAQPQRRAPSWRARRQLTCCPPGAGRRAGSRSVMPAPCGLQHRPHRRTGVSAGGADAERSVPYRTQMSSVPRPSRPACPTRTIQLCPATGRATSPARRSDQPAHQCSRCPTPPSRAAGRAWARWRWRCGQRRGGAGCPADVSGVRRGFESVMTGPCRRSAQEYRLVEHQRACPRVRPDPEDGPRRRRRARAVRPNDVTGEPGRVLEQHEHQPEQARPCSCR